MKYLKVFEEFDFSEGMGQKLSNYNETKGFDGKGFKDGIRVFIPQNMDSRAVCYKTEGGWVLKPEVSKKEEVSFFVISTDGKQLTCYDGSNVFSSVDKSDLLESFNMTFKTQCSVIERPNVFG
jgi:hypothetical protein